MSEEIMNSEVDELLEFEDDEIYQLPSGNVLSPFDTYSIMATEKSCFTVIMGATGSGKTTLVTSIYQQFLSNKRETEFIFAGSRTLLAFEERARYTRTASNRSEAKTMRTPSGSIEDILHLRIKNNKRNKVINLLLSDFSGEDYDGVKANIESAQQDFSIVKAAKKIIVIIDGKNIAEIRSRHSEIQKSINILKTFCDGNLTHSEADFILLISKSDLIKDEITNDFLSSIQKKFVGQIPKIEGKVTIMNVAAMPSDTTKFTVGYGIAKLIDELVKENKHCRAKIDTTRLRSQFNLWGDFSVGK